MAGKNLVVRLVTALVLGFALVATPFFVMEAYAATPDANSVGSRLQNVTRLIEISSGAKQVEASGNQHALELRAKARDLLGQATSQYNAGQYADADLLLTEATQVMFDAVRVAGAPDAIQLKKKKDFENLLESINALRQALERVAAEKGMQAKASEVALAIDPLIVEAQALAAKSSYDLGRQKLSEAYQIIKTTIVLLRDGDTLIKSTTFASKADEYQYESTRNETLVTLLQVMSEDKISAADMQRVATQAAQDRLDAARLADKGDYVGAINLLDLSSRALARELGRVGIFIPM